MGNVSPKKGTLKKAYRRASLLVGDGSGIPESLSAQSETRGFSINTALQTTNYSPYFFPCKASATVITTPCFSSGTFLNACRSFNSALRSPQYKRNLAVGWFGCTTIAILTQELFFVGRGKQKNLNFHPMK